MDPDTAKLVMQLQIADINDLLDGLYDDKDMLDGDSRISFQKIREDLQKHLQLLEGQVLTLKILREEHESRVAFSILLAEEKQAAYDHRLAMRLAGLAHNNQDVERGAQYEESFCSESDCGDDTQWDMAKELYAAAFERDIANRAPLNGIRTAKASELTTDIKPKILGSNALTKCNTCMDVVPHKNTLTLECKPEAHTYCRTCLTDFFKSALVNTNLFPPRCCKIPVLLETCRAMLPKDLTKDFDLKVEELSTPNPMHRWNANYSKFIRPNDVKAEVGTCAYCKDKTCVRCKRKAHVGLCPSDPHVQLLMDVAKRSRWQQCTKCSNMVELAQVCSHMT